MGEGLSAWWLLVGVAAGLVVGQSIYWFSHPHRMFREAMGSAVIFGSLWGATGAVFGLVGLNVIAGETFGAVGFAISVVAMAVVAGVVSVISLALGAWMFVSHPRRLRGGKPRNGRLRV